MKSQVNKSMNRAIQKTISDFLSKKTLKNVKVDKEKKKLFDTAHFNFICSRIPYVKELVLEGKENIFCEKCIFCLLNNQKRKAKVLNVTWAPKKSRFNPIKLRSGKSIY